MPPSFTTSQIITQLTTSWDDEHAGLARSWFQPDVSYSMPNGVPLNFPYIPEDAFGIVPMTAVMQDSARLAFELWDDLIAINLNESPGNVGANIVFNYSFNTKWDLSYAASYLAPGIIINNTEIILGEQIWLATEYELHDEDFDLGLGGFGFQTYLHEIGHTLGLSHPGHYSAWDGEITYAEHAEFAQDHQQYTIMSYFGGYEPVSNEWYPEFSFNSWLYASTPMLYDIAAIQAKYGADYSTRSGDTVYGFNSTADRIVFDFTQNPDPIFAIWDGGGIDTLDASGYWHDQYININAGQYSDIGGMNGNVAIAYGCVIENAVGGSGDDLLIGTAGDNTLNGGAGGDVMKAGDGGDIYVVDDLDDEVTEYANQGNDSIYTTISFTLPTHVEQLHLKGNDPIDGTGNPDSNWLFGNNRANILDGAGGADAMSGGAGGDVYLVNHINDFVIENAGEGNDSVFTALNYTLPEHVEWLFLNGNANVNGTGNGLDNLISGNDGSNVLDGMAGADDMYGNGGNDTYKVDDIGDTVTELFNEGQDSVEANLSYALGDNIENLVLSNFAFGINGVGNELNNIIVGNWADNVLKGGGGNDTLDGGLSSDTMVGGIGDDSYSVERVGDAVIENAGEGIDWVYTSIDYDLGDNVENMALYNSAGMIDGVGNELDNVIVGNSSANKLWGSLGDDTLHGNQNGDTLSGGPGDDVLYGGTGADTLRGGSDDDWFYVDNAGDTVVEAAGGGNDRVLAAVTYLLAAGSAVEVLTTTDNFGLSPLTLGGNELDNTIFGNGGDNVIKGGGGADTLIGWGGDDWYLVDSAADVVSEAAGEGALDRVFASASYTLAAAAEIEILTTNNHTGVTPINLTGNGFVDTIYGNDGDNVLDGQIGADVLVGRAGDDMYIVDNAGDTVTEAAGQGVLDAVNASVSYTLGSGQEIEVLQCDPGGIDALNLYGNASGNTVKGNAGSNALAGGDGNDTLLGRGGVDAFVFNTTLGPTNVDHILDFSSAGGDKIVLHSGIFTTLAAGTLAGNAFYIGAAAHDADDRIIYDNASGEAYYDADGIGGAAQIRFAVLTAGPALSNADFMVM